MLELLHTKVTMSTDARSRGSSGPGNIRKEELERVWISEHEVVTHSLSKPLVIDNSKIPKETVCQEKGVCVCGKPEALLFQKNLVLCLKHFFPTPKKKDSASSAPPSPEAVKRQQLQEGFFVLRLQSRPAVEHSACDLWLHLGYINYSSWDFACLKLHWAHEQPQRPDELRLTAVPDDNLDEDLCLVVGFYFTTYGPMTSQNLGHPNLDLSWVTAVYTDKGGPEWRLRMGATWNLYTLHFALYMCPILYFYTSHSRL